MFAACRLIFTAVGFGRSSPQNSERQEDPDSAARDSNRRLDKRAVAGVPAALGTKLWRTDRHRLSRWYCTLFCSYLMLRLDVYVAHISEQVGWGVFAAQAIPKGTLVGECDRSFSSFLGAKLISQIRGRSTARTANGRRLCMLLCRPNGLLQALCRCQAKGLPPQRE